MRRRIETREEEDAEQKTTITRKKGKIEDGQGESRTLSQLTLLRSPSHLELLHRILPAADILLCLRLQLDRELDRSVGVVLLEALDGADEILLSCCISGVLLLPIVL